MYALRFSLDSRNGFDMMARKGENQMKTEFKKAPNKGTYYYVMEMVGFNTKFHYAPTIKDARKIARKLKDSDLTCSVAILRPVEFLRLA